MAVEAAAEVLVCEEVLSDVSSVNRDAECALDTSTTGEDIASVAEEGECVFPLSVTDDTAGLEWTTEIGSRE